MVISYEEALKAQRTIEDKLLEDPNIVSIGVVEETDNFGKKTGDYAIEVGITSAEIYQNALNHRHSIIPQEYPLNSENGSLEIKNVHIKVVKTGPIKALSESRIIQKYDLPSARADIPAATLPMFSINRYPSGRTHTFSKDIPLKIIRRTYASTPQVFFTQNHNGTKTSLRLTLLSKIGIILGNVGIYAANKMSLSSSFQSHIPAHRRKFK